MQFVLAHLFILIQAELYNASRYLEVMNIKISGPEHDASEGLQRHQPVGRLRVQLQLIIQGNLPQKAVRYRCTLPTTVPDSK